MDTVFNNWFEPACSPIAPQTPYASDASNDCPAFDPAESKRLLAEAGVPVPYRIEMQVSNTQDELRFAQALQASVAEGGFDLEIVPVEYSTLLDVQKNGTFEALALGWSGRIDPDGNTSRFLATGKSANYSRVLVVHIGRAAGEGDADHRRRRARRALRRRRCSCCSRRTRSSTRYRTRNLTVHATRVAGVEVYSDGVVRLGKAAFVTGRRTDTVLRYTFHRLWQSALTLVLASIVVFIGVRALPGDPATAMAGEEADPETVAAISAKLGLDQPIPVQYLRFLGNALRGDFGESVRTGTPVDDMIGATLPVTVQLAVYAMLIAVLAGMAFGVIAAVFRGRWPEWVANGFSLFALSVPTFWLGILAVLYLAVRLGWFPASGYVSPFEEPLRGLYYLTLPAVILGMTHAAVVQRQTRRRWWRHSPPTSCAPRGRRDSAAARWSSGTACATASSW